MTTKQELLDNGISIDIINAAEYLGIPLEDIEETYAGEFNSDADFAQDMADNLGLLDNSQTWPYTCIDWEHAASELMYDYVEHDCYYFRNI